MTAHPLTLRDRSFVWGVRTYLMGILNVTPDSFSDGGDFSSLDAALTQAQALVAAGADILDIGGQSTRPGAKPISVVEEINRVVPLITKLRQNLGLNVPISVDTTRSIVAQAAVEAGADLVNDISGGIFDPNMLSVVASLGVPIALMHIRGTPETMQQFIDYQDLVGEIYQFLATRIQAAIALGIDPAKIIIDPGIGFAKTYAQNLEILQKLPIFRALNCPILIGVSRKSFIGQILNQPDPKLRIWGTAGATSAAIAKGADILRVHDVQQMQEVCLVADLILRD